MAWQTMYPGIANSIETTLVGAITAYSTTIYVLDATNIPAAPTLLVIGGAAPTAETVLVTVKNGTTLTVQRGFEGAAKSWPAGTVIARNFTNYDYSALINNIDQLDTDKADAADIPTKTSDLTNDSNFAIDASYVHTDNNYTTTEKNKLAGIAANANNYSLPTASNGTKGGVKVGTGLVVNNEILSLRPTIVDVTASKTLALTDEGKMQDCNSASAIEITIPLNSSVAFAVGTSIAINRLGAGTVTVKVTSGVTLNGATADIAIATQYKGAVLRKLATDTWLLQGDI